MGFGRMHLDRKRFDKFMLLPIVACNLLAKVRVGVINHGISQM